MDKSRSNELALSPTAVPLSPPFRALSSKKDLNRSSAPRVPVSRNRFEGHEPQTEGTLYNSQAGPNGLWVADDLVPLYPKSEVLCKRRTANCMIRNFKNLLLSIEKSTLPAAQREPHLFLSPQHQLPEHNQILTSRPKIQKPLASTRIKMCRLLQETHKQQLQLQHPSLPLSPKRTQALKTATKPTLPEPLALKADQSKVQPK